MVKDGKLTLLTTELTGPNGIAFSPDEQFLYVTNWDSKRKVVMRYPVKADGTVGPGIVFFDMTSAPGEDALDGMKVDRAGHLFVSGPGGRVGAVCKREAPGDVPRARIATQHGLGGR